MKVKEKQEEGTQISFDKLRKWKEKEKYAHKYLPRMSKTKIHCTIVVLQIGNSHAPS